MPINFKFQNPNFSEYSKFNIQERDDVVGRDAMGAVWLGGPFRNGIRDGGKRAHAMRSPGAPHLHPWLRRDKCGDRTHEN
jgi:hypothetical protein